MPGVMVRKPWRWITGCLVAAAVLAGLIGFLVPWVKQGQLIAVYRGPQSHWPAPHLVDGLNVKPLSALPKRPPFPADNEFSAAKAALGKRLFFDPRLSRSDQIACASCHDPNLGWADGRPTSIGHNRQIGDMNAPTVLNSGYKESLFWDGRAPDLESQIIASWSHPKEMAAEPEQAAGQLATIAGYAPLFNQAFGTPQVTAARISKAIATFLRTLNTPNTRFDQFMRGKREALSHAEVRGLDLFRRKAHCMRCHNGPLLSDGGFHHLPISFHGMDNYQGRYNITQHPADAGAFQTPGLRNIRVTAPYMHNGFGAHLSLEDLISLYNIGWWQNAPPNREIKGMPLAKLPDLIEPLGLNKQERNDLAAFLDTLTGSSYTMQAPELPQ